MRHVSFCFTYGHSIKNLQCITFFYLLYLFIIDLDSHKGSNFVLLSPLISSVLVYYSLFYVSHSGPFRPNLVTRR